MNSTLKSGLRCSTMWWGKRNGPRELFAICWTSLGESEVKVEPLNLDEIVDNAIRLVGNQVKMAKVKLEVEKEKDLPPVHGDAQMLCQVFVNLILNAVDAPVGKGKYPRAYL